MKKNEINSEIIPVTHNIKILYISSFIIAFLVTIVSIISILCQNRVYPTEDLLHSFVPNDVVNVIIGIPFLLISMLFTKRGNIIGLLCWPGALFYMAYVYLPYILSIPFNLLFLPYLILFSLSIYTLIGVITSIDENTIRKHLSDIIPSKVFGVILIGLSIFIVLRQVSLVINALINQTIIAPQELAIWVDDFTIGSPAMFIGGLLLWKKKSLGYVVSPGLFINFGILSLGLIPFLIVQSYLKNTSVDILTLIILIFMAGICLIPFMFIVRGVKKTIKN